MKYFITVIMICATLSVVYLKADVSRKKDTVPSPYAANSVIWYGTSMWTNVTFNAFFATDGTILTYSSQVVKVKYDLTNQLGVPANIERTFEYPSGLTVADKFQNIILGKVIPPEAGNKFSVQGFDGKRLLITRMDNEPTGTVILYQLKKNKLVKLGESTTTGINWPIAYLSKSRVYVYTEGMEFETHESLRLVNLDVLDKKMKKKKWERANAPELLKTSKRDGTVYSAFRNGVVCVFDLFGKITFTKKGKAFAEHSLPGWSYFIPDKKGGVLYWTEELGTNSPLTYINRKQKKVFEIRTLEGPGNVGWEPAGNDGKVFYVQKTASPTTLYGYSYGKKIKKLGQVTEIGYSRLIIGKSEVYIITKDGTAYGIKAYDRKLKKVKWSEPPAEGTLKYIGKETFVREVKSSAESKTTFTYTVFNKKNKIAEHIVTY